MKLLPLSILLALGFGSELVTLAADPTASEAWSKLPKDKWPQIVLTNAASFKDHTPLKGASGFLIKSSDGSTLAATARHLLGANGGVDPEVTLYDLQTCIESWVMHPRTHPEQTVKILESASLRFVPRTNDWVLLRVEGAPTKVTSLVIRNAPVKVGEKVHLIGVSYDEPTVAQKVYSGVVTERSSEGDRFRYDITPHVNLSGFSGAPIVDDEGRLVGIMTVWFRAKKEGDLYTEGGGEDAVSALEVLKTAK